MEKNDNNIESFLSYIFKVILLYAIYFWLA